MQPSGVGPSPDNTLNSESTSRATSVAQKIQQTLVSTPSSYKTSRIAGIVIEILLNEQYPQESQDVSEVLAQIKAGPYLKNKKEIRDVVIAALNIRAGNTRDERLERARQTNIADESLMGGLESNFDKLGIIQDILAVADPVKRMTLCIEFAKKGELVAIGISRNFEHLGLDRVDPALRFEYCKTACNQGQRAVSVTLEKFRELKLETIDHEQVWKFVQELLSQYGKKVAQPLIWYFRKFGLWDIYKDPSGMDDTKHFLSKQQRLDFLKRILEVSCPGGFTPGRDKDSLDKQAIEEQWLAAELAENLAFKYTMFGLEARDVLNEEEFTAQLNQASPRFFPMMQGIKLGQWHNR